MHPRLEWKFIPAGAPHMGGLWAAGVKSFKAHFRKLRDSQRYTFEELSTVLCRIEACLNSRPLSAMSENPSEPVALTPGHFLVGNPLLAPAEPAINQTPISLVNRWHKMKSMTQHLCLRWKEEYLLELHRRYKWKFPQRDITVNDLVVVRRENLPPNLWALGRVTRVRPGADRRVRVAEIRTAVGTIVRPITKLVVLPTDISQ